MIPVFEPTIGAREREYVDRCLDTGWISSNGEFLDRFERAWAEYCGRRHGVAVANGTVALQLAIASLRLEPGDEVIMPSFTIVSCALAAIYEGAVPVLVDADAETWCMAIDQIEAKITPRTRAIMPVHIYGHPCDMQPLLDLAERHGLAIVEDAAEAHGAEYRSAPDAPWQRCGSFGALSCFSFYANKIVTTGEGGMVVTDDDDLAARLRQLRNLGFGAIDRFRHDALGFNFRMTNIQAAIGLAQVERVEDTIRQKRELAADYAERLTGLPLQLPVERTWARNVYWMYGVVIADDHPLDARALADGLRQRGVETRPFFVGLHEQEVMHRRNLFVRERHPVAERLARRGLYLPSAPSLGEDARETVADAVRELLA